MNMRVSSPFPAPWPKARRRGSASCLCRRGCRCARGDVASLGAALGLTLPERIGARVSAGERQALRLGPDEWTILAPAGEVGELVAACAGVYAGHPHSLVDISGRELTLLIEAARR